MVNVVAVVFLCGLALISATNHREQDVLPELQRLNQLSPMALEFAERFQDFKPSEEELISEEDQLCLDDLAALTAGIQKFQLWALKMMDSWGSTPSGQLTGNLYDLGNFDECINIRKEVSQEGSANRTIQGKYCFRSVYLAKSATCIPASCSAAHMKKYMGLSSRTGTPSTSITINDSTCQTSEREPWDGLTIFMIVLLSVLATLVALFTLWDYFVVKNQDELPAVVKVFSARVSSRALFRVVENKSNPNVIDCLHGIRCMSLIWVVFGHQYISSLTSASINLLHITAWETTPFASFIMNGFYSVDSFFMLGGLLVSLISLRLMDKTKGKLNVPLMYLHRLIRIVPLLGMAILIYMTLMPVISGGPLFVGGFAGKANCEKYWHWTLLFVNNWTDDLCLGHTWYLSLDMQLFLISPILLITIHKWGKKVAAAIFVLIILLSGCLFATMMVNDYSMTYKNFSPDAMRAMYFATHTHATPWLIGFLFGYFLYLSKGKKFQLSRLAVWSGWILCLAMLFTSIFALYPAAQKGAPPLTTLQNSFYYTLTRLGWSSALCWVVFACMQGYGGLANSFLSTPLWQPLSRLSYSVYIWHMFIQEVNARNVRTNSYFSDYSIMVNFWSSFGFTLLFSYVMYLLIEAPFGGLDQFMRPKTKNPPLVKQKSQIDDNAHSNLEELQVITPTSAENEAQK